MQPITDDDADRVGLRAWYALFVLMLLYIFAMIDRTIISMLIGAIKVDLKLQDFQASLLMGTAFGISYVLLATPFGWAADRFSRPRVLAFGLLFWSLACMAGGLTSTFVGLFISRLAVGAGEACLSPTAYPLIAELFRGRHLPRAMAMYHYTGTVGASIALLVGGLVAGLTAQTGGTYLPFIGAMQPWQLAFFIVGGAALPLVFLTLTLPDPRHDRAGRAATKVPSVRPFVLRHRRLLFLHHLGFGLAVMLGYGKSFWMPEFLIRTYKWDIAYVGTLLAVVTLTSALIGQFIAVKVIEVLTRRGVPDASIRGFVYIMIFGCAAAILAFTSRTPALTIAGIFLANVATIGSLTYGSSSLQMIAPDGLRGRLSGSFVTLVSLLGLGVGPALIGAVSSYLFDGAGELGLAILSVVLIAQLLVIALLGLSLAPFRTALREAQNGVTPASKETA